MDKINPLMKTRTWPLGCVIPLIRLLLAGVFNRSPKTGYFWAWDVKSVLNVQKNWSSTAKLSNKHITYKFVVLKALASAAKAYAIHHLGIRYMLRTPIKYIFILYVTLYLEKGSVFLTVSISKLFGRPRIVSLMIISQELETILPVIVLPRELSSLSFH